MGTVRLLLERNPEDKKRNVKNASDEGYPLWPWIILAVITTALLVWTKLWFLAGFLAIEIATAGALWALLGWVSRKHPRLRNAVAFLLALGAGEAAGFTVALAVRAFSLPTPPELVAVIPLWAGAAIVLHFLSWKAALVRRPVAFAYLAAGLLSTFGAPDKRYSAAGLFIVALGLSCMLWPKGEPTTDFRLLVWNYKDRVSPGGRKHQQ